MRIRRLLEADNRISDVTLLFWLTFITSIDNTDDSLSPWLHFHRADAGRSRSPRR